MEQGVNVLLKPAFLLAFEVVSTCCYSVVNLAGSQSATLTMNAVDLIDRQPCYCDCSNIDNECCRSHSSSNLLL